MGLRPSPGEAIDNTGDQRSPNPARAPRPVGSSRLVHKNDPEAHHLLFLKTFGRCFLSVWSIFGQSWAQEPPRLEKCYINQRKLTLEMHHLLFLKVGPGFRRFLGSKPPLVTMRTKRSKSGSFGDDPTSTCLKTIRIRKKMEKTSKSAKSDFDVAKNRRAPQ